MPHAPVPICQSWAVNDNMTCDMCMWQYKQISSVMRRRRAITPEWQQSPAPYGHQLHRMYGHQWSRPPVLRSGSDCNETLRHRTHRPIFSLQTDTREPAATPWSPGVSSSSSVSILERVLRLKWEETQMCILCFSTLLMWPIGSASDTLCKNQSHYSPNNNETFTYVQMFRYENTDKSALYTYDVDVCFAAVLAAKLGFPWIYEYITGNNCKRVYTGWLFTQE